MKARTVVLGCLTCMVVLLLGYEYSLAQPKPSTPSSKIGVLSIRKIFRNCKANNKYIEKMIAEKNKTDAEEDKLSKEISAHEAGLKTLVPGSNDHLTQIKQLFEKKAQLEAMQQFNRQQRALMERRWTEELYSGILRITNELAKDKGLDLVLERAELEFPMPSTEEFVTILNTHKVLYSGGCVDISDEVTARLDAEASKFSY